MFVVLINKRYYRIEQLLTKFKLESTEFGVCVSLTRLFRSKLVLSMLDLREEREERGICEIVPVEVND